MMRTLYLACSLAAFAITGETQASPQYSPVAETINGSYKGVYLPQYDQDLFLGIPFAQPPLETRRFRDREPLTTDWTGERPATKYAFVNLLRPFAGSFNIVPG